MAPDATAPRQLLRYQYYRKRPRKVPLGKDWGAAVYDNRQGTLTVTQFKSAMPFTKYDVFNRTPVPRSFKTRKHTKQYSTTIWKIDKYNGDKVIIVISFS
jgi:hypothetical protein